MTITETPTSKTTTYTRTTEQWTALAEALGSEFSATAPSHDRTGLIDKAAFDRLRAEGITSALVPTEFGGGGASHADMGAILRTIARHDPSVAVTLAMHSHLVAFQVWRHNRGMDAEKVFRKVVDDKAMLVSTGASDWVGSSGTVERVDGGYRVSGRKSPASGAEVGQIIVTSFRWESPEGPQVIHCSVPKASEGVSIETTWDTMGLRATGSHTVVFDNVFVPEAAVSLTRPADVWHPVWNIVLNAAMPLIMAAYLGIADAAADEAIAMSNGRDDQHVVQLLGEMSNAHTAASDLVAAMFAGAENLRFDNVDALTSRTLSRKTVAADAVIDTVRLAIEATGGRGYSRGSDLERLYRDVHGVLFHPLPRAKQTHFTGRVTLGLSPIG
jgi:alkylation response protein AidB-like acyl-CoA dehydrogenase